MLTMFINNIVIFPGYIRFFNTKPLYNLIKKVEKEEFLIKARGGGEGTIFRLLVILPKITDGTNDEMCIHFRGV